METDNRIEVVLRVLCEINNRLSDIAMTLQTLGCLSCELSPDARQHYINRLQELSSNQQEKYAALSINYPFTSRAGSEQQ